MLNNCSDLIRTDRLLRRREQSNTNNKFSFLFFTIVIETKEKLVSTNALEKDLTVIFSRVSYGFDVRYLSIDENERKKKFCFFSLASY